VGGTVSHVGGETVAAHWNGSTWSASPTINHNGNFQGLNSVATLADGTVWAVGSYGFSDWHTLIEQYSSTNFTDVPEGSTFYPYVKCLACRGVVSGYPDGTFRPNNPVTRGQIAKIVTIASRSYNAQAAEVPSTDQYFEDIPTGSTFFEYIGWLASQNVISGYPCGGQGEPCVPPGNLPYYRPTNTNTRGQLTKIVSNTARFNDPIPPDTQTFADVIEGSTFYTFTERLILNRPGVMSGYPCGGPGEPCDPQSRPYFRPGATVSRGQSSKIVSNTFLPDCSLP